MNERIKQLAEQAEDDVVADHRGDEFHKAYTQRFAELIVRECGQYLNSPEFIGRSDLDWAMVLNEHFGVE